MDIKKYIYVKYNNRIKELNKFSKNKNRYNKCDKILRLLFICIVMFATALFVMERLNIRIIVVVLLIVLIFCYVFYYVIYLKKNNYTEDFRVEYLKKLDLLDLVLKQEFGVLNKEKIEELIKLYKENVKYRERTESKFTDVGLIISTVY